METVTITISKDRDNINIASSEGQSITISNTNKELKATETIAFLNYNKDKTYSIDELSPELQKDKNIVSIYTIFKEIVDKLNPIPSNFDDIF